jgi:hypothetical protein
MKYYLDYMNTNNLGAINYDVSAPEIASSFFAPNLALVIFDNCFAHDKWNNWNLAGELKSRHGRGCAINTMRFLNLISEDTQIDMMDQTTPIYFTPFDEIIRLTARPAGIRIIERQFDISTAAQTGAFFDKLNAAMPANTCVIFRLNSPPFEYTGAKTDAPVMLHPGHVAIISKGVDGQMYEVDVLYGKLTRFHIQDFINKTRRYLSLSLMFEVVTPSAGRGGRGKRTRRRHIKRKTRRNTKRR